MSVRNLSTNLGTTNAASITVTAGAFAIIVTSPVPAASINGVSLIVSG